MISQIYINPVIGIIESIFLAAIVFTSFYIIYRLTPEKSRVESKYFSKNGGISILISFAIILFIKILMQILETFHTIFTYLYKDTVLFSIMVLFFTLFYRILVRKASNKEISSEFKRWNKIFMISCLILSILFLSVDLLNLFGAPIYAEPLSRSLIVTLLKPENYNEVFYLSFFNAVFILVFIIGLSYLINRIRGIKVRISKPLLKKTIITSSFIAYFIWSYQFFLFGAFLGQVSNLGSIEFDFRIQILIIIGLYLVSYFYFLKYKYIPESAIES
ncbi:MAG: hypothetical protein ACTSQW_07450, partial [Promethearchaeota archaeon]